MIVVAFRLDVEKEAPFSEFYHHRYIPNLMRDVPTIKSARRYQEHHVTGSLKYYSKQFLTLFECDSSQEVLKGLHGRSGRADDQAEWQKWQAEAIRRSGAALRLSREMGASAVAPWTAISAADPSSW